MGRLNDPVRQPDALDAGRVLALGLGVAAGASFLASRGLRGEYAGAIQQAGFLLIPLLYARIAGLSPLESTGFVRISLRTVALVVVASLGTMWLLQGLVEIQREILELLKLGKRAVEEEQQLTQLVEGARKKGTLVAVALLVIVPPFCEETFFRGIILRGLASRFGAVIAAIGTSAVFAALHLSMVQIVLMVFLGLYLAALVRLTGSLWSSVLAHAMNNLAVVALNAIYGGAANYFHAPWWMTLLSAIVFALAMTLLALDRKEVSEDGGPGGVMKYSDRR